MYKSMNFWSSIILTKILGCFNASLSSKSEDLCVAGNRVLKISGCNFSDVRFENVNSKIMFIFKPCYDGLKLLKKGLFDSSISKLEYDIKVVFIDADIDQKLIDIFFVIKEFILCLLEKLYLMW